MPVLLQPFEGVRYISLGPCHYRLARLVQDRRQSGLVRVALAIDWIQSKLIRVRNLTGLCERPPKRSEEDPITRPLDENRNPGEERAHNGAIEPPFIPSA